MEGTMGRNLREEMCSPERSKLCAQRARIIRPSFKKLQVIYYLSRNAQLEHPHYMELTHLLNQPLRLKDVLDRLTFLRGKGMPSLYSWSCKRSYKNGYVWYDLAENDEIYPSDGAEYVLKGSELLEDVDNAKKFEAGSQTPKRKMISVKRHLPEAENMKQLYMEEDEDEEYEVKNGYTTSTTPHSRCSIGVSTEELELPPPPPPPQPPKRHETTPSPPSTTSSSTPSDKASRVFEDGDPVATGSLLSRNSVLLQLISCGGSMSFRGTKHVPSDLGATTWRSSNVLHKGVLCKAATAKAELEAEETAEIMCMSENPRFGNCGIQEREYFSGTIVEEMATEERVQLGPTFNKSSSYNEERSCKAGFGEGVEDEVKREKAVKANCMPRMNCSGIQFK